MRKTHGVSTDNPLAAFVTHGRTAVRELEAALDALELLGTVDAVTKEGRTTISTVSALTWTRLRELPREDYRWPPENGGHEIYEPYVIYEGDGGLRLALAYNNRPIVMKARERRQIWVFLPGPNGETPGRPLTPFVAADDYGDTHELVALIRGRGETGRQMYGPRQGLPEVYEGMPIEIHRDRIRGRSHNFNQYCVVAHEDDVETMLKHGAAQVFLRGL